MSKYYLRLKMIISFLEFEIFWESLFTFLLIQIALWHKLDSSCKKDFTKIMQNDWKVNKLCWLFTQNQCRNNILIREIDTLLYFPLDFILESRISPRRRLCRAANDTSLKHQWDILETPCEYNFYKKYQHGWASLHSVTILKIVHLSPEAVVTWAIELYLLSGPTSFLSHLNVT